MFVWYYLLIVFVQRVWGGGIMFIQWFMYDKAGKDGLKEVWDSRELGRINCLIGVRIREARMRE